MGGSIQGGSITLDEQSLYETDGTVVAAPDAESLRKQHRP
jgi:hypothetical protein